MVLDGPCSNTMNPTKDATYTFLAMFLQEVGTIFKDEYLFLGGDEVTSAPCPLPCPALPSPALLCSALLVASELVRVFVVGRSSLEGLLGAR